MTADFFPATPDCVIATTRIFDFSKELIFKAWSDPNHLKNWWGPTGFTNTIFKMDVRAGGEWDFIMHGPEKGNYHNLCEFVKIEKPNLIAWKRHSQPLFKIQATFEEAGNGKTKVAFKMIFDTAEECEKLKKFVVDKNEENFDRLESELEKMTS